MAKSIVRNKLGGRTFGFAVPADGDATKAFCDNHLEGEYEVFEVESQSGNETEARVIKVTITGKSDDNRKTTFSFYAKAGAKESEIRNALLNVTFNNVRFSEIYITEMSEIALA